MIKRRKKLTSEEIDRLRDLAAYGPLATKKIDAALKAKNWAVIESAEGTSISAAEYSGSAGGWLNVLYNDNGTINEYWRI